MVIINGFPRIVPVAKLKAERLVINYETQFVTVVKLLRLDDRHNVGCLLEYS